jgi:hypothetical protein
MQCQTNGVLEIEFQNAEGRQLRVTENPAPAAAPAGFVALEPVSYIVELGGGAAAAQGLTLQKIDYIRNANSELLSPSFPPHPWSSPLLPVTYHPDHSLTPASPPSPPHPTPTSATTTLT